MISFTGNEVNLDESSYSYQEIQDDVGFPLFNLDNDRSIFDIANRIFAPNQREYSDVSSEADRIENVYIQNLNRSLNENPIYLGETTNTSKNKKNKKENDSQVEKVPLFSITNNKSPNNIIPKMYYLKEIINILQKNKCDESIINKINPDIIQRNDMECLYFFRTKSKTNESTESFLGKKRENENNPNEKDEKMKRGRKPLNKNISAGKHTNLVPDNIIKKIKALFFKYGIDYINAFIKQKTKNEVKLLYLDYKQYIDRLKKDFDLWLLNMKVEDFASLDISEKYCSKANKEYNKNIIKDILEKEKDNTIIINFLRNMTFNDLIDILLFKKTFENCIEFDGFLEELQNKANESDEEYFSKFILFCYNYKRWFLNKTGRTIKKTIKPIISVSNCKFI